MLGSRSYKFFATATVLIAIFSLPMAAEDRPERPQVAAATAVAVRNLREQIERTPIAGDITVGDLLRRTGAADNLTHVLERAELIGGPRWVDGDTCQIQIEISGLRIIHMLEQAAAGHPKDSPLSASEIARECESWNRHTFSGSGTSTAFNRVAKIGATAAIPGWAGVSEADRQAALAAARADATARLIDSIKPIALAKGKTVGDALAVPEVRTAMMDWLENRPVTRVEYRRDLQIELTMAGTPDGCYGVLRRAVTKLTDLPIPKTEAGWLEIREAFERRMAAPIGRGSPPQAGNIGAIAPPRMAMPAAPPDWIDRTLEIVGISESGGSKLKAAREAETLARRKLAEKIGGLSLSPGVTIADAAERDPHVRDAISAAIEKARTKTDYNDRQGVSVTLRLDLRDLWNTLQTGR